MAQNKGLGRGYASLMGMNEMDVEEIVAKPEITTEIPTEINLTEIDPNYEQPRKSFDQDSLQELANSIIEHGVIQPIIVTKIGKRYMIIAGERRFRASKLAHKTTIPAIVRNYTAQQIREISLVENLQRDDLNAIEAARAIKELMTNFNMTQEHAADRLGKSRPAVANTLRLLTLDDRVIALIEKGDITAGHGRALVSVSGKNEQYKLAEKIVSSKLSVRETEKAVRELLNPKPEKPATTQENASLELRSLVANMQRVFATKVTALGNDRKGRICIDYFTADDLGRICILVDKWMKNKYDD